jgi:hypothetical protein
VKSFLRGPIARSRRVPWYERDGGERFRHDDAIVQAHSPSLEWQYNGGYASLEGTVAIIEGGGVRTPLDVRIEFPDDYPRIEPKAFDMAKRFPWVADRHFTDAGGCCLWLPPRSKWRLDDPDSLRMFLDEVAVFFYRQLLCDDTQRPGPSWAHGVYGYWEFINEELGGEAEAHVFLAGIGRERNDRCPCGRKKHFKRCHWRDHQTLARRIPPSELKRLRQYSPAELDEGLHRSVSIR